MSHATAVHAAPSSPLLDLLDDRARAALRGLPAELWERALFGPARAFLGRPGKQFRARLVENSYVLAGGEPGRLPPEIPALVELLHAGSLIVDDIEDGSAQRRGAPALHRVVGTALALNTGNWLYFAPLALLDRAALPDAAIDELYRRVGRTMLRCHEGQALDLAARVTELDRVVVPRVASVTTALKTGALLELAAAAGAIAAGAPARRVEALARFGGELGTGLQMLDDLGSLGARHRLHKGYEDLRGARPTWPWAWAALATADDEFAALQERARGVVAGADPGPLAADLYDLVCDAGRDRIHARLQLAVAAVADDLTGHPALAELGAEIERLEQSYA